MGEGDSFTSHQTKPIENKVDPRVLRLPYYKWRHLSTSCSKRVQYRYYIDDARRSTADASAARTTTSLNRIIFKYTFNHRRANCTAELVWSVVSRRRRRRLLLLLVGVSSYLLAPSSHQVHECRVCAALAYLC